MLALGFLSLLAAAIAAVALGGLFTLRAKTRESAADTQLSRLANEVGLQALLCRRYEKDFFLSAGNPDLQQEPVQQWHMASIALRESIKVFEEAAVSDADRQLASRWREAWRAYVLGFGRVEIAISDARIRSPEDAVATFAPSQANIQTLTDEAVATAHAKGLSAEQTSRDLEAASTWTVWQILLITSLVLVISVVCALLFPAWLVRPIGVLHSAALRLSQGDLTARAGLRREDELGLLAQRFDAMAETIQRSTHELQTQYAAAEDARALAEDARAKVAEQLALIEAQRATISEMSIPILPLSSSTLVMPLVGDLDGARLELAQMRALSSIETMGAHYLILDITGVPVVDTMVAKGILMIVQTVRLLGCQVILAGIRPEVAQTIVSLGIDLQDIVTLATLQSSVVYTIQHSTALAGPARGMSLAH